jgi:hypothetical protein
MKRIAITRGLASQGVPCIGGKGLSVLERVYAVLMLVSCSSVVLGVGFLFGVWLVGG